MAIKNIKINKKGLQEMEKLSSAKRLSDKGADLSIPDKSEQGKQKTLKQTPAYVNDCGEIRYRNRVDFGEVSNYWD